MNFSIYTIILALFLNNLYKNKHKMNFFVNTIYMRIGTRLDSILNAFKYFFY